MKKLNVIDFDETLIEYDSFRVLCIEMLVHCNARIQVFIIMVFRIFRIYGKSKFKEQIHKIINQEYMETESFHKFHQRLVNDLRPKIMSAIQNYCANGEINVLVSASPDTYIKLVAKHLGWEYLASHFDISGYIHMYASEKIRFVHKTYPTSEFIYNFAISDSRSDLVLLTKFKSFILLDSTENKNERF